MLSVSGADKRMVAASTAPTRNDLGYCPREFEVVLGARHASPAHQSRGDFRIRELVIKVIALTPLNESSDFLPP